MLIRPEQPSDFAAIRAVLLAAFKDHPYSNQTEHLIVESLRKHDALALALVAEQDHRVVGHIAFSSVLIDGCDQNWFGLGPVAVRPDLQRQGIGKSLILSGLDELKKREASGCILVGDPDYYKWFGFDNCSVLNIKGVPANYLLVLPFAEVIPHGTVRFHEAFDVCAP